MLDLKNLSDLESHIVMLALLAFDRNGSSRAFFISFLSSCKDDSDGMKRLDRIVLGLFACKENSNENEVFDRIVPACKENS